MTNKNGTWPHDDIRRAFVAGAKWWEFEKCKATMWNDDVRKAETEAEKRYGSKSRPHTTCAAVVEAARDLVSGIHNHDKDIVVPEWTSVTYKDVVKVRQALAELDEQEGGGG